MSGEIFICVLPHSLLLSFTPDSSRSPRIFSKEEKETVSIQITRPMFCPYKNVPFSLERIGPFQDCFPAHVTLLHMAAVSLECAPVQSWG